MRSRLVACLVFLAFVPGVIRYAVPETFIGGAGGESSDPGDPAPAAPAAPAAPDQGGRRVYPPIAHAGGSYRGVTYTNSLQALEENAGRYELFEIDWVWTADDRLVGLHDWGPVFRRLYGFSVHAPLPMAEARRLRGPSGVSPLDLGALGDFMAANPEIRIVTDIKGENLAGLERISERVTGYRDRIIPQFNQPGELEAILALGYRRAIWSLYAYSGPRDPETVVSEVRRMLRAGGDALFAVSMPVVLAENGLAEEVARTGAGVYAHTVNDCSLARALFGKGVHGIYTDVLTEENCRALRGSDARSGAHWDDDRSAVRR